jgi:hypothetical protein
MKKLFLILFLLSIVNCQKPSLQKEIETLRNDTALGTEEKYHSILKLILKNELKEMQYSPKNEKEPETLEVLFGGTSGLTFLDSGSYKQATIRYISLMGLRIFEGIQPGPGFVLRLSFSKPFYVKGEQNEDVILQEFEIYRTGWNETDFQTWKKENPKAEIFTEKIELLGSGDFIENFQKKSKPELDEFKKITVE